MLRAEDVLLRAGAVGERAWPHGRLRRTATTCLIAALLWAPLGGWARAPVLVGVAGHARFEFLTPSLVRMEYSPSGEFVDAATAVVLNRDWPAVKVDSAQHDGWLVLRSSAVTVRYRLNSGPFGADNLVVSWGHAPEGTKDWHPGDVDTQNLGGLTYSLDHVGGANLLDDPLDRKSPVDDMIPGIEVLLAAAKPGLLSRSGYALIDDSRTPVWNADRTWIEPRAHADGQDWYLFTYDHDYAQVLRDYARLCGPVPMVPRWALGAWITDFNFEYFPGTPESRRPGFRRYDQQYLEHELARLRRHHIPFDTVVLDFAWHNYGWDGGYDWSPLFPQPDQLVRWLHDRGIKLSLNDHPGYVNTDESIVSFADSHAPAALKALGRAPPPAPSFDLDVSRHWMFAADPDDRGVDQHWFAANGHGAHWRPIAVDRPWQQQGHAGGGVAWYRTTVSLPSRLPPHVYLWLGEVGASYRIFVDEKEATHSSIRWPQRLTFTDLTPYARGGRTLEIALRVVSGKRGGGIMRGPVAIRDVEPPARIYFDLSNRRQAEASMRILHEPLMRQGVDAWWVDGGSGAVDMPGLNGQMWTNKVFYDFSRQATGKRAFILGRYGDWGSERYPGYFTGDTFSEWRVLAYEVAFSARAGNVLVPYVSHDIGGFHGRKIPFGLYARWIEFGAFSPILRMHSAHENPREGNLRMPWVYGDQGIALMKKYFTLHTQLIPYVYSYAWLAHTQSRPIMRPLYLAYPDLDEAYRHPHEYFYGDEMLVAPVVDATGERSVYLPPGRWMEFVNGKRHIGGAAFSAHYAVDEVPVFVREGSIIPEQPVSDYSDAMPLVRLIVNVYGNGHDHFELYEDDGVSLDASQGHYAVTPMTHETRNGGAQELVIEPSKGSFSGQVRMRGFEVRIHGAGKPRSVSVNGRKVRAWTWDAQDATAIVTLPARAITDRTVVAWRQ